MPQPLLFYVLTALWVGSEIWINRRHRSAGGGESRDRGTLKMLLWVIYLSIFVAVFVSQAGIARWPRAWIAPLFWIGIALMGIGLPLRWWAVRALDRWFTVDVAIREGHRLIQHGPYRWLRHPSYTGALLLFLGMGLALGSWLSLLLLTLPVGAAFLHRIRVEEAVLASAFAQEYPAYAARTWRLLPFIW